MVESIIILIDFVSKVVSRISLTRPCR